jgi:hypothetical protein
MKIFNRRNWKSFAVAIPIITIFAVLIIFPLNNKAESQSPVIGKMVLTGQLMTPSNQKIYVFEDPERDVICYARYHDLSGGFSCVKK